MKSYVIDINVVSPHIAPLALALRDLGVGDVKYVYTGVPSDRFRSAEVYEKIREIAVSSPNNRSAIRELVEGADFVMENVRDFDLMERRVAAKHPTAYSSERWFKPIRIDAPQDSERARGLGVSVSGFLKLLLPPVLKRARRLKRLLEGIGGFVYLANGVFAVQDMARMCGLLNGDIKCLFRPPRLMFEKVPGGCVHAVDGRDDLYCLDKIRLWGYFVEPGDKSLRKAANDGLKRILWVGRMFGWKRLDTLIKAVGGLDGFMLDIYGNGPDEVRVRRWASKYSNVRVFDSVLLSKVRELMREHDIYVLSSNVFEGWGAVVNEALEEGMCVLGTYEAGSCATILPESHLFHAGDWRTLRQKLLAQLPVVNIGAWTAENAARILVGLANELDKGATAYAR